MTSTNWASQLGSEMVGVRGREQDHYRYFHAAMIPMTARSIPRLKRSWLAYRINR
jgi:hypothetical protein